MIFDWRHTKSLDAITHRVRPPKDVRIISSYPDEFTTSENSKSLHNTIFFSQPVTEQSDSIMHFEYVGEYTVSAQYYSPDYIRET